MDLKLAGRTALITGSTSGIGAAIAAALAREGATVVVHGRSESRAQAVTKEIVDAGGKAHFALGDLGDDTESRSVVEQTLKAVHQVDILINNVGGSVEGKVSYFDTTVAEWAENYNSNALAAVRMILAFVPAMKKRGWGRVIQISSRNAISPHANMPSYGAAKAAINNFTLGLSKELAFSGVTANAVMPGLIYTQQVEQFFRDIATHQGWGDDTAKAKEHVLKNVVRKTIGRLGEVNDIANYICYLASPLSDFMTGSIVRIDGGATPTV